MLALVASIALQYGVDAALMQEIVKAENPSLNPECIGSTGDIGIMQLNPKYLNYFLATFWDRAEPFDAFNPEHNITIGVKYFKWIQDTYPKFGVKECVMAYNCGPTRVLRGSVPAPTVQYAENIIKKWRAGHWENTV